MLPIHKESLRTMLEEGLVNDYVKISVLRMLKPIVCANVWSHGDIKDSFNFFQIPTNTTNKTKIARKYTGRLRGERWRSEKLQLRVG